MDETELKNELGISKFGLRRKLFKRLSMFTSNKENLPQVAAQQPAKPDMPALVCSTTKPAALQQSVPQTPTAAPLHQSLFTPAPATRPESETSRPARVLAITPWPSATSPEADTLRTSSAGQPLPAPEFPCNPSSTAAARAEACEDGEVEAAGAAVETVQVDDGPSAEEMAAKKMAEDAEIQKQLDAEGQCISTCKWVISQMRSKLRSRECFSWADKQVREARFAELHKLEKSAKSPGMTVVVVGNTGAGKSTMLNSLLGERNVLPTNGMRACTAALVELTYQQPAEGAAAYAGEVDFITEQEWEKELDDLFADLTQQDGRAILHVSDPDQHNYASWCKAICAVMLWSFYGQRFNALCIVVLSKAVCAEIVDTEASFD
eukprot:scaffold294351_cov41-Prasinocladus_malaysianus.AAC.1